MFLRPSIPQLSPSIPTAHALLYLYSSIPSLLPLLLVQYYFAIRQNGITAPAADLPSHPADGASRREKEKLLDGAAKVTVPDWET